LNSEVVEDLNKLAKKEIVEKYKNEFVKKYEQVLGSIRDKSLIHIIYHVFWRSLIPITVNIAQDPDAALLPADTRVPYYTIYDHLYTASGIVPALLEVKEEKRNKFGIVHWEFIGTQSFLAQSRAMRDVWASSFLISLLNTALIIKLANEYGFDAIINPNMLFNPFVDLYLSCYVESFSVNLKQLRFLTTPDKCFCFVPYDKVDDYVDKIPQMLNELWQNIAKVIKGHLEKLLPFIKNDDWDLIWEETTKESPIRLVCVGEQIDLNSEKIERKIDSYPPIIYSIYAKEGESLGDRKAKVIQEIKGIKKALAEEGYPEDYQFVEFPLIMEYLKFKRKIASEQPRLIVPNWLLKGKIVVEDKKHVCTTCYIRRAVIDGEKEEIREKLPLIKENERLCPVCIIKRMLPDMRIKDIDQCVLARVIIAVFKWIDGSKEDARYVNAIKKSLSIFLDENKTWADLIEENIFSIPSLDTISTFPFKSTLINLGENLRTELVKLNNMVLSISKELGLGKVGLLTDSPPLSWISKKLPYGLPTGSFIMLVNGYLLIPEELRRMSRIRNVLEKMLPYIRELENNLIIISEKIDKFKIKDELIYVTRPSKYVSLIRADGDNMGKLLSGTGMYSKIIKELVIEKLKTTKNLEKFSEWTYYVTPSYYSSLSRILSSIARKVAEIADKHYCYVIYSGGDDILAFSGVETSVNFAVETRKLFSDDFIRIQDESLKTSNYSKLEIKTCGFSKYATQSFVIHIMHVFSPIKFHLNSSFEELEYVAKAEHSKNSLVISYSPRGGVKLLSKLTWYYKDIDPKAEIINLGNYLLNLVSITLQVPIIINLGSNEFRSGNLKISHRAFRDFLQEIAANHYNKETLYSIFQYEVKRHGLSFAEDKKPLELMNELISEGLCRNLIDKRISIGNKYSNLFIELLKAVICLRDGLDSVPIKLGGSL